MGAPWKPGDSCFLQTVWRQTTHQLGPYQVPTSQQRTSDLAIFWHYQSIIQSMQSYPKTKFSRLWVIFYASCTSVQILYTSQICIYWIYTQQLNIYTLIFSSLKSFLPTPNLHYPQKSSASVFSLHQSNSSKNWLALMEWRKWRKLCMVMGIHSLIPRASQKIEKYLKFHHPVNLQVDTPRPNIPIHPHFPPHSSINPSDLWEETHKSPKLGQ